MASRKQVAAAKRNIKKAQASRHSRKSAKRMGRK
jgi:hypothetical protein